jgi:hypothetical protein
MSQAATEIKKTRKERGLPNGVDTPTLFATISSRVGTSPSWQSWFRVEPLARGDAQPPGAKLLSRGRAPPRSGSSTDHPAFSWA